MGELHDADPTSLKDVKMLELFMNTYLGCEIKLSNFSPCKLDPQTGESMVGPRYQSLGYWWSGVLWLTAQGLFLRLLAYLCLEWQAHSAKGGVRCFRKAG